MDVRSSTPRFSTAVPTHTHAGGCCGTAKSPIESAIAKAISQAESLAKPSSSQVIAVGTKPKQSPLQARIAAATRPPSTGPGVDRLSNKKAWAFPEIPTLPGLGPTLKLFDSSRREVSETHGIVDPDSGKKNRPALMYVCGITPYDATHLGHAATMIAFDLVNRAWRASGVGVKYVQNVTDIDDPLLRRAKRDNVDWVELAVSETDRFRRDMTNLRVIPPAAYIGAVEAIPSIVQKVTALLEAGIAYRVDDGSGDVYFDISKSLEAFAAETHLTQEEMLAIFADRGGDPDRAGKRHPLDPLLWRGPREGEPAWPGADLGPGRPGWHIECTAIAQDNLGPTIDVQGGGSDLQFPHHAASKTQAEAMTGETFAKHYVHTAMIGLNGEKMSKRRGNLVFVSKMWEENVDPMALRLALVEGHYRADRQWTPQHLERARTRLDTWRKAASQSSGPDGMALVNTLRERLADDLDTPAMLAIVDAWAADALAGKGDDAKAPKLMSDAVDALLGVKLA